MKVSYAIASLIGLLLLSSCMRSGDRKTLDTVPVTEGYDRPCSISQESTTTIPKWMSNRQPQAHWYIKNDGDIHYKDLQVNNVGGSRETIQNYRSGDTFGIVTVVKAGLAYPDLYYSISNRQFETKVEIDKIKIIYPDNYKKMPSDHYPTINETYILTTRGELVLIDSLIAYDMVR